MQAASKAKIAPGRRRGGDRQRNDRHHGGAGGAGRRLRARDRHRSGSGEARHRRPLPWRDHGQRQDEEPRRGSGEAHRQLGRRRRVRGERQRQGVRRDFRPRPARAAAWSWSACRSTRFRSTSSRRCVKEARIETVFRYANVHARAIELIASGKVDLKPLISGTFPFEQSVEAVERAASGRPGDVKLQIKMRGDCGALTWRRSTAGKSSRRSGRRRRPRHRPSRRGQGIRRLPRALGLREVDDPAHDRGARGHFRRRDRDRRPRGQRPPAARPQRRDGVSELRALPAYVGLRQHRLRAAGG